MPANWSYVLAAYGLAAVALFGYWRHLARRARALSARRGAPVSYRTPHRTPS